VCALFCHFVQINFFALCQNIYLNMTGSDEFHLPDLDAIMHASKISRGGQEEDGWSGISSLTLKIWW
jgi:hypothetical protein